MGMKEKIKKMSAIKWIKSGIPSGVIFSLSNSGRFEDDALAMPAFREAFEAFRKYIPSPEIKYLTKPFINALKSAEKHILEDLWNSAEFKDEGILIIGDFVYFYSINTSLTGVHDYKMFVFSREGHFVCTREQVVSKNTNLSFYSRLLTQQLKPGVTREDVLNGLWTTLMGAVLFIKFSETESKITKPKEKIHFQTCRYYNDTDDTIHLYDCTWFTTLIKGEGFGVRGHFRLQPYKNTKKIVWIDSYKKEGYTRKAKILTSTKTVEI